MLCKIIDYKKLPAYLNISRLKEKNNKTKSEKSEEN